MFIAMLGLRLSEISDTVKTKMEKLCLQDEFSKIGQVVWSKICKIKENDTSNTVYNLSVNDGELKYHCDIANALADSC